jgi:hypothetical protein
MKTDVNLENQTFGCEIQVTIYTIYSHPARKNNLQDVVSR